MKIGVFVCIGAQYDASAHANLDGVSADESAQAGVDASADEHLKEGDVSEDGSVRWNEEEEEARK